MEKFIITERVSIFLRLISFRLYRSWWVIKRHIYTHNHTVNICLSEIPACYFAHHVQITIIWTLLSNITSSHKWCVFFSFALLFCCLLIAWFKWHLYFGLIDSFMFTYLFSIGMIDVRCLDTHSHTSVYQKFPSYYLAHHVNIHSKCFSYV